MDSSDAPTVFSQMPQALEDAVLAARTYHQLVRAQLSLDQTALGPFIERGCFSATLHFQGEPSDIVQRFPQWARSRALAVESDLVREISLLYRELLNVLGLEGELPQHFSSTTLSEGSHELACLTRLDDLADLATALSPLANSVFQLSRARGATTDA